MTGIYKITSPIGKIYIGRAININRRFTDYKRLSCKQQPILYQSFLKYGVDSHTFEVLLECEREDLNERESYYIKLLNSTERGIGMNCTYGGDTCLFTDDTKLKMSKTAMGRASGMKGRKHSQETKDKMSQAKKGIPSHMKGKKVKRESVERMIKSKIGFKHSEETKIKMSIARKGKTNLKKVIDEKTGEIFESVTLAAIYANLKFNTLVEMLKGRNKNKTNLKYYKP